MRWQGRDPVVALVFPWPHEVNGDVQSTAFLARMVFAIFRMENQIGGETPPNRIPSNKSTFIMTSKRL